MEKINTNNCLHVDQNLIKRINKSIFLLHQLVIKRKEKQNKRNVKHDDVKTNVIYFRTINYCDI